MQVRAALVALAALTFVTGTAEGARAPTFHSDEERIFDHRGREVLLRGFHHIALRSNRMRPTAPHSPPEELFELEDIELEDFRTIASMGLNSVRMPITWEFAQPDAPPAPYDQAYLALLDQAVARAHRAGVRVIMDFAQFGYGRVVGGNAGAPAWTVSPACLQRPANPVGPPQASPRVHCAFTDFWNDVNGIQTEYIKLWRYLADRYRSTPGVVLFDLFNEPLGGAIGPVVWERDYLYPFYRRLAAVIREADPARMVGFQPSVLHSAGLPPAYIEPIGIDNAAYMAHNYTAGFVAQQADPRYPPGQSEVTREDFRTSAEEAAKHGAPFLNGETGWVKCAGDTSSGNDSRERCDEEAPLAFIADMTAAADELRIGWHWSEYSSDPSDAIRAVNPEGVLDERMVVGLARPFPQAVAGRVTSIEYDTSTKVYVQHTADRFRAPSEIALPVRWQYPRGACVRVNGRAIAAVGPRGRARVRSSRTRFLVARQVLRLPAVGAVLRITPGSAGCRVR